MLVNFCIKDLNSKVMKAVLRCKLKFKKVENRWPNKVYEWNRLKKKSRWLQNDIKWQVEEQEKGVET